MVSKYHTIGSDIADWLMERKFYLFRNGRGGPQPNRDLTDEEIRMCQALKALYPHTKINAKNFNQE
jgi:hypothetical protein